MAAADEDPTSLVVDGVSGLNVRLARIPVDVGHVEGGKSGGPQVGGQDEGQGRSRGGTAQPTEAYSPARDTDLSVGPHQSELTRLQAEDQRESLVDRL